MSNMLFASPVIQAAEINDPPLIPSIYDDEFDSAVLDASWSRLGTFDDVNAIDPSAGFSTVGHRWSHNSLRPSWYMIQPVNGIDEANIYKPITFPSEFFAWSRMSFTIRNTTQANNESLALMRIEEAATADGVYICLNESDANTIQVEIVNRTGGGATVIANSNNVGGTTRGQAFYTVGIQRINTAFYFWALASAGNWCFIGNTTYTGAIDRVRLGANVASTTAPGNMIVGFDYFRFKTGRYLP